MGQAKTTSGFELILAICGLVAVISWSVFVTGVSPGNFIGLGVAAVGILVWLGIGQLKKLRRAAAEAPPQPPSARAFAKRNRQLAASHPPQEGIEGQYPGDDALRQLLDCYEAEWRQSPFPQQLLDAVGGDELLARGVHALAGRRWRQWLDQSVPALQGLTPRQCLDSPAMVDRLKALIMRMP